MIPKIFDRFEKDIGLLPDCIEGIAIEERNGMCEIEVTYLIFCLNWNQLLRGNIIVADVNDTLVNQKFRIYKVSKPLNGKIKVYARHIFFDLARDFIENVELSNASCEYALNTLFRSSQFSQGFSGHSNIINAQDYNITNVNLIKAIGGTKGSILDTFGTGAEILRDNKKVYILNRRGHDNGVTIEYSKNMTGLNIDFDDSKLITRIKPFAKYNAENNKEVIVFSNPKYVDSPLISNYETPFICSLDFTDKFKDGEVPTPEKLKILAEKYFIENKCDQVKNNIKVEFIPLSKCVGYKNIQDKISLCDTVTIKDFRYNLNTQAKVIKTYYNFLADRYEKIELGEARTSLGDLIGGGEGNNPSESEPSKPPLISDGSFPDTIPKKSILEGKGIGLGSIELKWTFENKIYYDYELYASKNKGFTPNSFDLIFKGKASAYLHQVKPNETYYYRVVGINTYGHRGAISDELEVSTRKIDDFEEYFSSLAVSELVATMFSVEYMEAGIIQGHWINAKNLSVTDGNGKRTLDIDSFGNVNLDVASFKVRNEQIYTSNETLDKINTAIKDYKKVVDVEFEEVSKAHDDLTTEMNGAFKDGLISQSEAISIQERLVALEKEKEDIYKEYNTIYSNSNLNNTSEKTELLNAKSILDIAYLELKNTILAAISDNKIIASEITNINAKTDIYNKASATYREKFTQAIDKIGSVKVNIVNSKTENLKESFTELKQSSEDFQLKAQQMGTANLLKNSEQIGLYSDSDGIRAFNWSVHRYGLDSGMNVVQTDILDYGDDWGYKSKDVKTLQIRDRNARPMTQGGEMAIRQDVLLEVGQYYTFSALVAGHRINEVYLGIRGTADGDYHWNEHATFNRIPSGGADTKNWTRISVTFVCKRVDTKVEVGMKGFSGSDPYFWITQPMLVKGKMTGEYTTNDKEIRGNVMKITPDVCECEFEDGTKTSMGRGGFYYKTGDGQWEYHALSLVGEARIPSEGTRYIYLPEVFRNKRIRVVCQVGQIGNGTDAINNPKPLISFWAGADDLQNNPSGYAPYFRLYGSTRLRNDDGSIAYRDKEVLITYTVLA